MERLTSSFRGIKTNFSRQIVAIPSGDHVFSSLGDRQFLGDFRKYNHPAPALAVRKFPFSEPTRTVNFSDTTLALDVRLPSHPSRKMPQESLASFKRESDGVGTTGSRVEFVKNKNQTSLFSHGK